MATTDIERTPEKRPGITSRNSSALWGGPFLLGILTVALGVIMLGSTFFASVVSIFAIGSLLAIGGIFEIVAAFRVRRVGGPFWSFMLGGILTTVVGVLFLARPGAGLASLTLLLAGFFFATGLFHAITSVMDRYPQWGWDFAFGVVSIFLGVSVMAQWPASSAWLVGALLGVELLMRGVAMMSGSLMLRRGLKALST